MTHCNEHTSSFWECFGTRRFQQLVWAPNCNQYCHECSMVPLANYVLAARISFWFTLFKCIVSYESHHLSINRGWDKILFPTLGPESGGPLGEVRRVHPTWP